MKSFYLAVSLATLLTSGCVIREEGYRHHYDDRGYYGDYRDRNDYRYGHEDWRENREHREYVCDRDGDDCRWR